MIGTELGEDRNLRSGKKEIRLRKGDKQMLLFLHKSIPQHNNLKIYHIKYTYNNLSWWLVKESKNPYILISIIKPFARTTTLTNCYIISSLILITFIDFKR